MVIAPERLAAATALHQSICTAIVRKRQADYDLALLLRRCFDEQLFRELGYISMGEYGEQAHGLGRAKTRALVRLAGTMRAVPAMADAVRSGVIPWTKAREVARVATRKNADEWVHHAKTVTNRELENLVRHARAGDSVATATRRRDESDDLRSFAVRNLSADQHDLIERLLERIRQDSGIDRDDFSRGDALATVAQRVLAELDADDVSATPSTARYQRVVHVCAACQQATGETGRPDDTDVHMSHCDAEVVELRPEDDPSQPIRGTTTGHRDDAKRTRGTHASPRDDATRTRGASASPRDEVTPTRGTSSGPGDDATRTRGTPSGRGDDAARRTRGTRRKTVRPSVRAAVLHRDRHQCRVPDCTNRLWLDVHHVTPRAHGGAHTEDNLVCLCASHHRLLHDGRLAITHAGPGQLRVQFADGRKNVVTLADR